MTEQDVTETPQDETEVEGHLLKETLIAGLAAAAIAAPAQAKPVDPPNEPATAFVAKAQGETRAPEQKTAKGKAVASKRDAAKSKKPLPPLPE